MTADEEHQELQGEDKSSRVSCNIGDGNGTEDDHRTQGIGDRKASGTKRGGGREQRTEACNKRIRRGN